MRLIIHAGIHRTGTTALQRVLADNRPGLAAKGIVYPFRGVHHQDLAWALYEGTMTGADLRVALLQERVPETHTVVVSGEDFCVHTDLGWVQDIREAYDVEVVFYLRRQDVWLASWYNQHVKWPFHREKSESSPKAFLGTLWEYHWLDYQDLLSRWERAVGSEGVHVGVVEEQQTTDVVAHFTQQMGVDVETLNVMHGRGNDSLPIASLEIARHLGLIDLEPAARNMVEVALRRAFGGREEKSEMIFSGTERREILERFTSSNRAVARRYFGREDLFLSRSPANDDPHFEFPDVDRSELLSEWVAPFVRELTRLANEERKRA